MGPLLFLIYINDIIQNLESEIYLYADDAVLTTNYSKEDTQDAFDQLNRDLDRLAVWASDNFMLFNAAKTKYMVITNTADDDTLLPDLKLNGTKLEKVRTYPQLGLLLNERMNWDDHITQTISRARVIKGY